MRIKGPEECRRLQTALGIFALWIRIIEQRGARRVLRNTIFQVNSADGDAGIHVTIEPDHSYSSAIPAAGVFLQIFDGLRGGFLGSADDR